MKAFLVHNVVITLGSFFCLFINMFCSIPMLTFDLQVFRFMRFSKRQMMLWRMTYGYTVQG